MNEIKEKLKVFQDFKFFNEDHHYEFKGQRVGISVTKFIAEFENEFKQQEMAELVANKNRRIQQEIFNNVLSSAEEIDDASKLTTTVLGILKEWKYKADFACTKGSTCHEFAQSRWSKEKYELDKFDNSGEYLEAVLKIQKQAVNFYNDYKDKLEHLYDEFVVGSEEYDIASAIDHLFINKLTGGLVLADYKTNSILKGYNDDPKNRKHVKNMKVPLSHIKDLKLNHYYIQLSIYRYLLEKYAKVEVEEMFIAYFSENIENYEIIEIPYLKNEVEKILEMRRVKNMKSIPILLMGASGTGKTRSLKNLPIKETAIINVANKPLPFKNNGLKVVCSTDYNEIISAIKSTKKKIIVIDDCGYLLSFENFEKATNKGYDKFTVMAQNFYKLIETVRNLDEEKTIYLILHEEQDDDSRIKPKMIGKMLNQQLCVEGLFTIVLRSVYKNGQYLFETKTDGVTVTKSPEEMFEEEFIPNDLAEVDRIIRDYYGFKPITEKLENKESDGNK